MRILMSRELATIEPSDTLPGRDDYQNATAQHQNLNLSTDLKSCDNFVAICSFEQVKFPAQEWAEFYKRTKITEEHNFVVFPRLNTRTACDVM